MISDLISILPGWEKVRFGDVARNVTDRIDDPKESGLKDYIGLDHLDTDEIRIKRFGSTDDVEATKFLCRKGDIIFGKRNAYLRKVAVTDRDAVVSAHSMVLRPKADKIEPEFLPCFMQSAQFWKTAQAISEGSMSPTIKWKTLSAQEFWLPSRNEQKKIAQILWSIESNAEKVERLIQVTEKLKKGLLEELLTKGIGHKKFKKTELGEIPEEWEVRKVRELFTVETGTTPSTQVKEYWNNGSIEWFTPVDLSKLRKEKILGKSERKISGKAYDESNLTMIPKGSLIISTRAPVGYVGLTSSDCTFNQGCKGLVPKTTDISSEFYLHYFLFIRSELERNSGGSTFKELTKSSLEKIRIVSVPKEEQEKIADIIDNFDKALHQNRLHKELSCALKKRLTNSFLSGELLVLKEDVN